MEKEVYNAINKVWKYYKKYSQLHPIDWDEAVKESAEESAKCPVPEFMRDLYISVQDQLFREEKGK